MGWRTWLPGALVGAVLLLGSGQHVQAALITVSASGVYTEAGGTNDAAGDAFTITNTSPAGISISKIVITLALNTFFDTVTAGGGQNPHRPYANVVGPAGGTATLNPADPNVADGATSMTVDFSGFDATETFSFTIDVDDTVGGNANARRNVPGAEFDNGATLAVEFTGAFLGSPQTFSGSYVVDGTNANQANVRVSGQVEEEATPVAAPATLLLVGSAGAGLGAARAWRRRQVR